MQLADVIEAVLANDRPVLHQAFGEFVNTRHDVSGQHKAWAAVCAEVCRALLDDERLMPHPLCNALNVCVGTTYARGADRLVSDMLQPRDSNPITSFGL